MRTMSAVRWGAIAFGGAALLWAVYVGLTWDIVQPESSAPSNYRAVAVERGVVGDRQPHRDVLGDVFETLVEVAEISSESLEILRETVALGGGDLDAGRAIIANPFQTAVSKVGNKNENESSGFSATPSSVSTWVSGSRSSPAA